MRCTWKAVLYTFAGCAAATNAAFGVRAGSYLWTLFGLFGVVCAAMVVAGEVRS